MSPTLRRAHLLHDLTELGASAADLFTRTVRRRHIALVNVPPQPGPGQLPDHFADLGRPRPFDHGGFT